jgi:hypothetical protein
LADSITVDRSRSCGVTRPMDHGVWPLQSRSRSRACGAGCHASHPFGRASLPQ